MTQAEQPQIGEQDKCYILMLAGGMGARIIQTVFIRSLIKKRKLEKTSYPIIVIDNSLIGHMVSAAMQNQNVIGMQVTETPQQWPQDPGIMNVDEHLEHPMFIDSWRKNFQQYVHAQGSVNQLINNNWSRSYQIEYSFGLTKRIHMNKLKNNEDSFIGHLYGDIMGLEYDNGIPMLKMTQHNKELKQFTDSLRKPFILLQLGVDRNPQEFMAPVNYRLHKVWSLQRWQDLVNKLKHKYEFVQVYANQYNPELENVKSVKVDNLNPVLQLLQDPKCRMFMSIDNYLPHLAASIKKRGVVLWGSVSPYVWGWDHNTNIWNKASCANIACWRPGLYDMDQNGKLFVCDHYSCMRSIEVKQVIREVEKLEASLKEDVNMSKISL